MSLGLQEDMSKKQTKKKNEMRDEKRVECWSAVW